MSWAGKDIERSSPYGCWIDELTCKNKLKIKLDKKNLTQKKFKKNLKKILKKI